MNIRDQKFILVDDTGSVQVMHHRVAACEAVPFITLIPRGGGIPYARECACFLIAALNSGLTIGQMEAAIEQFKKIGA